MLSMLTVQNFAIIDNISIDFKPGLTILTGETGAGKSLIIDAIGLLLGDRASSTMVRSGYQKAIIEGVFSGYSDKISELLQSFGIDELPDRELSIRKEIALTGKTTTRINGILVTVNELNAIAEGLADIHTQDDTKKLFQSVHYLDFIETEESRQILRAYQKQLAVYQETLRKYQSLKKRATEDANQLEFMRYQANELAKANLSETEETDLEQELYILNNYENIFKNLASIKTLLEDHNITGSLFEISAVLKKLSKIDNRFQEHVGRIDDTYYEIEDFESFITSEISHLSFDEERLNQINERLSFLKDLKRRYRKTVPELIVFQTELTKRINEFDQMDDLLVDAENDVKAAYGKLAEVATSLTQKRKENANQLEQAIKETLKDLYLVHVQMKIGFKDVVFDDMFNSAVFHSYGTDNLEILISFNVGEPMRDITKVASGGELSRIMLALKTHLLKNMNLATMIFDEIDQGVSGSVASAIAKKLKTISEDTQVLAITHLPIVASCADHHILISKKTVDGRTVTVLEELTMDRRIQEIAQMLSPDVQDDSVLALAKDMINFWH